MVDQGDVVSLLIDISALTHSTTGSRFTEIMGDRCKVNAMFYSTSLLEFLLSKFYGCILRK